MSTARTFTEFLAHIRAGDEQATAELFRQYEPLIRREIRMQLEDQQLRRLFDSMDVCQLVLFSFFRRAAKGEYDLERPEELVALLVTMARNKLAEAARKEHRECRDRRRVAEKAAEHLENVPDSEADPGEILASEELLEQFRRALSEEERQIVELRSEGLSWEDVAAQLGGTAQARRMQLRRAFERVVREVGIDAADLGGEIDSCGVFPCVLPLGGDYRYRWPRTIPRTAALHGRRRLPSRWRPKARQRDCCASGKKDRPPTWTPFWPRRGSFRPF